MSEKEYVHAEIDTNHNGMVQICCSPATLVFIIATMLIRMSKKQNSMSLRQMLEGIILMTGVMEEDESRKGIDQMIDETLREARDENMGRA